jgi:nitrate/nitrite transport system substrate-binding protein
MAAAAAGIGVGITAGCGGDDDDAVDAAGAATTPTTGASGGGGGGSGGSSNRTVKLGFIALTDCASVVMADELGYFAERDLEVEVIKQASWPALRDALLNGEIDGAHCLFSMPLSVATNLGGAGSRDLKVAMVLSQNGQAITLANSLSAAGYGDPLAAGEAIRAAGGVSLGMTFPGGTHDTWLRYWLKAGGVDLTSVGIDPIPPPEMVQNMSVGNVAGYCVGEPWNAVAVQQGIGFTAIATQDLWLGHSEKALVVTSQFASERADVLKDVMGAILQASTWLDEPANRSSAADTLGQESYVNAPPDNIRGRLTGEYDLGGDLGTTSFGPEANMRFFGDGAVNLPRRAHAMWFLAQYQRFGLLTEAPPYQELVDDLILTDLYAEVAAAEGVTVPDDDMAPFEVVLDGITFDPNDIEAEVARV